MPKSGRTRACTSVVGGLIVALATIGGGSPSARAAEIETRLEGRVVGIANGDGFDSATLLAQRGLRVDTPVSIAFTIDDTASPGAEDGGTAYPRAVVAMSVGGGLYQAVYSRLTGGLAPSRVLARNDADAGQGPVDSYAVEAPNAMDTGDIIRGGAAGMITISLLAEDATGRAMSDESIAQDVSAFAPSITTVIVEGDGGRITIEIGDDGVAADTSLCRAGQLAAAATFCSVNLKCRAKRAGQSSVNDLGGVKEAKCLDRARAKFEAKFRKAIAKAGKKGGACGLTADDTAATADALNAALDALTTALLTGADRLDPDDRRLRGKLLKVASKQAGKDLAAYAKHAKKPNQAKLDGSLAANRAKTVKGAGKALDQATAKGLDVGSLGATSLAISVRALVDEFVRTAQ